MAGPSRWVVAIAIVVFQIQGSRVAVASLTFGGAPGEADKLSAIIAKCREMSPVFNRLYQRAANDPLPMRFDLVRGDPVVEEGQYAFGGTFTIDMADLETRPDASLDANGQLQFSGNASGYAVTRCEIVGHMLAALYHNAKTSQNFAITRRVGRYWQNQVRKDLGQPQISRWGHSPGGHHETFFAPSQLEIVKITNGNFTSIQWVP